MECEIASADSYFRTIHGYGFNAARLPQAHGYSHEHCVSAIQRRVAITVIDNTNVTHGEWYPYMELARNRAALCRVSFACDTVDHAYDLCDRSHADIEPRAVSRRHVAFMVNNTDFQA
jgi:hypothetical protein